MKKTMMIVLVLILIGGGYYFYKSENKGSEKYTNTGICGENGEFCPGTPEYEERVKKEQQVPTQAKWFIPNQAGWSVQTLTWKTYSLGNVSFSYPPNYVITTKKQESRPGVFWNETTITDPNSRSETDDTIYVGVPYTGAADPNTMYEIKENVNNSGIDFSTSLEASNFAKYILSNIAASVSKN